MPPPLRPAIPVAVAILALAIPWVALGMVASPVFPLDDAYIVLKNALVLAGRETSSFPDASPVSGATSLVHLLVVRAALVVLPPEHALSLVSFLAAGLLAVAVYRLSILLGRGRGKATAWLLACLFPGLSLYHLSNGLETALAMATIAWAVVLSREEERWQRTLLPLILGVMPFVRPELGALTLLLGIARMWTLRRFSTGTREALLAWARFWGVVGLAAAPFLLTYLVTLGHPLPNTVGAKKLFFAEGCRQFVVRAWSGARHMSAFLAGLGVVTFGIVGLLRRNAAPLLLFLLVFVGSYVVALPGALAHNDQRYLYPLVPLLVYGLLLLTRNRPKVEVLFLSALALQLVAWSIPDAFRTAQQRRQFTVAERGGVAQWIRDNLPPSATLLVHDAGHISLATPNPLVDMVGLKTPAVIDIHRRTTWESCGTARAEAYGTIAELYRPDYMVVLEEWDRLFEITTGTAEARPLTLVRPSEGGYSVHRFD